MGTPVGYLFLHINNVQKKTTGNYDIEEIVPLNIVRDREGAGIGC